MQDSNVFGLTDKETTIINNLVDSIKFLYEDEKGSREDILSLVENILDRIEVDTAPGLL